MKRIYKTWLIGTIAAGLLISGGFVLQHNQAWANDSMAIPTPKNNQDKHSFTKQQGPKGGLEFGKRGAELGKGGISGVMDFASILGIDNSVLKAQINAGKSLVQIAQEKANLSEDALLAKLTEAETKRIDTALSAGKIKQEQADKLKADLAARLKKTVESTPKAMHSEKKPMLRGGNATKPTPGNVWGDAKEIAAILGITEDELAAERKAGKSLAEIAQAKGITEDQLIAKLKDGMTDKLKSFVERKGNERPALQPRGDGGSFKGKPGRGGEHRPATTATPAAT